MIRVKYTFNCMSFVNGKLVVKKVTKYVKYQYQT